jgi:hypothetical protein
LQEVQRGALGPWFSDQRHMSVGVRANELLVRIDPAETDDEQSLAKWVRRGAQYAASLPKK